MGADLVRNNLDLPVASASFSWLRMCSWVSAICIHCRVVWFDEPGLGHFYLTLSGFWRFLQLNLLFLESWNKFRLQKSGESRSFPWRRSKLYKNINTFVSHVRSNDLLNNLVSVIHSFVILLASIWYNQESFNFSFEGIKPIQRWDAISAAPCI